MNKSQFFKYLENGNRVKMITWHGQQLPEGHRLGKIRYVTKVQSNAVQFNDDSWLYRSDINAKDVTEVYTGNNRPSVNVGWAVYTLID